MKSNASSPAGRQKGSLLSVMSMRAVSIPPEIAARKADRPYFDESRLPDAKLKYVAWVDLMGAGSIMSRSLAIAANHVGKIHVAALKAEKEIPDPPSVYPIVDGAYLVSLDQDSLLAAVKHMVRSLALTFVFEEEPFHRFMLRGSVSCGAVFEGAEMCACSTALEGDERYARYVLLGPALTNAHDSERHASPFGIWIHESARMFAPPRQKLITATHWRWWDAPIARQSCDKVLASTLAEHLRAYLDWCETHSTYLLYDKERIRAHRALAEEYFAAA